MRVIRYCATRRSATLAFGPCPRRLRNPCRILKNNGTQHRERYCWSKAGRNCHDNALSFKGLDIRSRPLTFLRLPSSIRPHAKPSRPLPWRAAFITQTKLFQRHCAQRIRIADATLREFDDFLGDNSCRWVVTNFEVQSLTRCHKGSRHGVNDLRLKGLMSKIWSVGMKRAPSHTGGSALISQPPTPDRALSVVNITLLLNKDRGNPTESNLTTQPLLG